MNRINGSINITMTVEEAAYINALMDRDEAKMMLKGDYYKKCPVCSGSVTTGDRFCEKCGQRLSDYVEEEF